MTEATCQKRVRPDYGPSRPCGRKVKDEGLCGIHLAAKRRVEANDAARREKWAMGERVTHEADVLSAALGTEVTAEYSWSLNGYSGRFVVSADWLRAQAGLSGEAATLAGATDEGNA